MQSSRSIQGIHSCTCIRHQPDTEGFSAPSSLCFLPLVFPISPLNRRFQQEHSARILSGFTVHPALRELSRWAPLQQPAYLLLAARRIANLARDAATRTSSAQGSSRRVSLLPPAAGPPPQPVPTADSHHLPWH